MIVSGLDKMWENNCGSATARNFSDTLKVCKE
jgi:hypothetical protein